MPSSPLLADSSARKVVALNWGCIQGKQGRRLYAYVVSHRNQFAQIEIGEEVTVLGLLWRLSDENRFEEPDLSQGQNLPPFMKKAGGEGKETKRKYRELIRHASLSVQS